VVLLEDIFKEVLIGGIILANRSYRNGAFAVLYPNHYDGQVEYNKAQEIPTNKWGNAGKVIREGLADILTFGMGALSDTETPAGLAYGMKAVANRHAAKDKAIRDYQNALTNNLREYDYLKNNIRIDMPFGRDEVTGNTDFSVYKDKNLLDQYSANATVDAANDIYKLGEQAAAQTYSNYGQGSSENNGGLKPLKLMNNAGNLIDNFQNVNNYSGEYGTFGNLPLQGNVSRNYRQPFMSAPVNQKMFENFYGAGKGVLTDAKKEKGLYYRADKTSATSRQNALDRLNWEKEKTIQENIADGAFNQDFYDYLFTGSDDPLAREQDKQYMIQTYGTKFLDAIKKYEGQ